MIVGDIDSAQVVTPKTIYETKKDGTVISKQVWESLEAPRKPAQTPSAPEAQAAGDNLNWNEMPEMEEYEPGNNLPRNSRPQTQRNYLQQYVDRVDEFLGALISREAMPGNAGSTTCRHCNKSLAVWRCKDCVLATPMCRSCMRYNHRENPFHCIERWNGSYYRPAELREVGTYLLIRHHTGESTCNTLKRWCDILDAGEAANDKTEQDHLRRYLQMPAPAPVPIQYPNLDEFDDRDFDMEGDSFSMESDDDYDGEDFGDGDEEMNEEPEDNNTSAGAGGEASLASATLGSLHRVVHTNGIHHIHMVSCQCHGEDVLPLDLFAAQLLPASLKRIKTIFTAQVLNVFRLCNLELKASAYQFYQLLRRLTRPMAPLEVVNLYREFRRMTRIWRWMKKLKWGGYAGSSKKVSDVEPGELAIFCPACPQPGINIPDDWKEDNARHV